MREFFAPSPKMTLGRATMLHIAEDDAGSGHHAAQRVPDHPYLAR
jgi:hypothetical protein